MTIDNQRVQDMLAMVTRIARPATSNTGIIGYGGYVLLSEEGDLLQEGYFTNLITDSGDTYYAAKGIVAISPASPSAPTAVTGMKLGTGSTAPAKNGAGAALVTYVASITANKVFDATYPQSASLGAGLGAQATYQTTWAAGQATQSGLNEVVIVNDAATDATSTAANTISRALLSPVVNKGANDTLAVTWNHKFLGA